MAADFPEQGGDSCDTRKKRKRGFETEDSSSIPPLSSNYLYQLGLPTPEPSSAGSFNELLNLDASRSSFPPYLNATNTNSPTTKRHRLTPRPSFTRRVSQLSTDRSSFASIPSISNQLTPCHVCCRRPNTMQDLPAYSDCESCHNRTCFVCMRKCEGPRCKSSENSSMAAPELLGTTGKNVCGNCCIEVGSQGRIWCLECYQDDTEPEIYNAATTKLEAQEASLGRVTNWLASCDADYDGK